MNSVEISERLTRAHDLQRRIEHLQERQDEELEPVARVVLADIQAMPPCPSQEAVNLMLIRVTSFPPGFHRTELRAALIRRQQGN